MQASTLLSDSRRCLRASSEHRQKRVRSADIFACMLLARLSTEFAISDQEADGGECSRGHADVHERDGALLESHYSLGLQVAVVLDLSEDHVTCEALHEQVELVLPELVRDSAHPEMWPSRIHLTVQILVVVDHLQALLQDRRVKQWVQCVAAH